MKRAKLNRMAIWELKKEKKKQQQKKKECRWMGLWELHHRAKQKQNAFVWCFLLCMCESFVNLSLEKRLFCEIRGILQSGTWLSAYLLPDILFITHLRLGFSGLSHSAEWKRLKNERGSPPLTVHLDPTQLLACSVTLNCFSRCL